MLSLCFSVTAAAQSVSDRWGGSVKAVELSQSMVWLSLLHSDGQTSSINEPGFLLSSKDFTPHRELQETLHYLYSGDPSAVCRFPARYKWLQSNLNLPELMLSQCQDLQEFLVKAPSHQISLIFASESLSQPASMMGHAFLKLSGQLPDGAEVSHAITFFTEAEGYNLPKLFVESTLLGKPGFFALSPFDDELDRYLKKEQRNVWFYDLNLDAATRELIQFHLHELKQTHLTYFFQSYNCATLLRYVLALSGQLPAPTHRWVTPKDVVKDVSQAQLVSSVSVDSPSGWLVRVLSETISLDANTDIVDAVQTGRLEELKFDPQSDADYLRFSFAQFYAHYLQESDPNNARAKQTVRQIDQLGIYKDKQLQTSTALNPANSSPDSQISFSRLGSGLHERYRLSILPASHLLIDNNSAYTQETELQLMGGAVSVDRQQRLKLDRLTLYKMQSYTPYHPLVGGLSTKFLVQWGDNPFRSPSEPNGWVVSSALGRTFAATKDVDVFGFIGLGASTGGYSNNVPLTAEVGAIIRELGGMKTVVSYERRHDLLYHNVVKDFLQIDQSKWISQNLTLFARLKQSMTNPTSFVEWEFGFKELF